MLLTNAIIENSNDINSLRITEGKISEKGKDLTPREGEQVIDCKQKLLLPPFIESHVHLDTCLTAGEPVWNLSGTLFEGIECWSRRKQLLSKEDIEHRVLTAVKNYISHGVQFIRTHVDITDPSLLALNTILDIRDNVKDYITIQVVAFPQEGILSFPNGKKLVEEAINLGADVIGAIPHFEFTREYSIESLNFIMSLAVKYHKLVDVHCDEIDDEASRGLETLATRAFELELFDKVTASHTTAMHSYNNAYVQKLMRLLKKSKINFISNPLVNTHLQGRADNYPKRRGVTRVKELTEAGINVSFGCDDIFDPWYPMGTGSMRDTVFMGLHVCQMTGYNDIMNAYNFVTYNAAKSLHLGKEYGIEPGCPANFIILDADNFYNALNQNVAVLASYRKGIKIAESKPSEKNLLITI